MGRWAQARRRGSDSGASLACLPPVLTDGGFGTIAWVYDCPDPVQWRIEQATTGMNDWAEHALVDGADRNYPSATPGSDWRVVGVDGDDNPTTEYSNRLAL